MKTIYLYFSLALLLLFAACQSNSTNKTSSNKVDLVEENHRDKEVKVSIEKTNHEQMIDDFLNLFEKVEVYQNQSLLIETLEKEQSKRIPPKFDTLLHQIPVSSSESHMESDGYIYAVNRFEYNEKLDALVIRHYGEYSPNRLSLFLWDKEESRFLKQDGTELSIFWGDAGYSTRRSSILSDFDKDGTLEIISRKIELEYDFDTETYTSFEDKFHRLDLEQQQFVKASLPFEEGSALWQETLEFSNQSSLIDSEIQEVNEVFTSSSNNEDIGFLFSPTSINGIDANTSIYELKEKFSDQVLEDIILYDYENVGVAATLVHFENEANNLPVIWKGDNETIAEIRIENKAAEWQTMEGIKMGSTIEAVQAANGKPFLIYGFEIDAYLAGSIQNWQGGNLDPLWLQFETTVNLPIDEFGQIMGSEGISSDHPIIKKADLRVKAIKIIF